MNSIYAAHSVPAKHNFLPYDKKALKPLLHLLPNQNQNAYSLIWDLQFPRNEGFNPILLFDTQFHLIGIRHRPIIFPLSLNQNFTEKTRTSNSQIVSLILTSRAMLLTVVRFSEKDKEKDIRKAAIFQLLPHQLSD